MSLVWFRLLSIVSTIKAKNKMYILTIPVQQVPQYTKYPMEEIVITSPY